MNHRMLLLFMLAVTILSSCGPLSSIEAEMLDPTPRIAILSAFSPELKGFRKALDLEHTYVINGRSFYTGTLAGQDVVLTLSGVSMVNAAMTAQVVIDNFEVEALIFSGIAGGVNPGLSIGDVVVPAQWGQYQEQLFARESGESWEIGSHSADFGNYGMMFPQPVSVTRAGSSPDSEQERFWFPVAPDMLEAARLLAGKVDLEDCGLLGKCLNNMPELVVGGNGVSGPTFVDNKAYRTWVWDTFQADALDMESAAVAHVAYVNDVPFLVFRSLSDLAGGGPGENEIDIFFQLAAENSARVVLAFLEVWEMPMDP
ncbi:MAG: 5'-methylthioadenosine/S-adenosylhomocysteine nucleosidase [Anaerolineales bacterium]|nr:5'-methylthioadenosine/S-adenosylhomocysteine nucleosidase [Anaerolineales bacterium]